MSTMVAMAIVVAVAVVITMVIMFAMNQMALMTICAVGLGVLSYRRSVVSVLSDVHLANAAAGAMVCGCCLGLFYFIHDDFDFRVYRFR